MTGTYREPPAVACPLCGCQDFVDGTVRGSGLTFVPADAGLLSQAFAVGWGLRGRKCVRCNHLLLFAEE